MLQPKVHVSSRDLVREPDGRLFGEVHIAFGDLAYPFPDWFDFCQTVLEGWRSNLGSLGLRKGNAMELRFMDGPHWLKVTYDGGGACSIAIPNDHWGRSFRHLGTCEVSALKQEVDQALATLERLERALPAP